MDSPLHDSTGTLVLIDGVYPRNEVSDEKPCHEANYDSHDDSHMSRVGVILHCGYARANYKTRAKF